MEHIAKWLGKVLINQLLKLSYSKHMITSVFAKLR